MKLHRIGSFLAAAVALATKAFQQEVKVSTALLPAHRERVVISRAERAFNRSHPNGGRLSGAAAHRRAARKLRNVRARSAK